MSFKDMLSYFIISALSAANCANAAQVDDSKPIRQPTEISDLVDNPAEQEPVAGNKGYQIPNLPKPRGNIVRVSNVSELENAVRNLQSDTTVLVAPGTYKLNGTFWIKDKKNISIRGQTNNPSDVVLVGKGMRKQGSTPHGVKGHNVNGFQIANITIRDVYNHSIQIDGNSTNIHIHNCHLIDAGEQFIKVCPDPNGNFSTGIVEYTTMEYTTTARGTYTQGVDVHRGRNWIIRNNTFKNIRAPKGLAGPAILMWNKSEGTLCEGNIFFNCQRGIHYGMSDKRQPYDHKGGIIRNNVFYRSRDQSGDVGIAIWNSPETQILHNTIILSGTYSNAIEYRFSQTHGHEIIANLCDAKVRNRGAGQGIVSDNITNARPNWFADPSKNDFHLTPAASESIDKLKPHQDVSRDYDGIKRPVGKAADIGAFEYNPKRR